MPLSNLDTEAEEPHLIYHEDTEEQGSVQIDIPAGFGHRDVDIKIGGSAIRLTDYSLGTNIGVTSSFSGDIWTIHLPTGPAIFKILVTALQDGVEPGGNGRVGDGECHVCVGAWAKYSRNRLARVWLSVNR